MHVLKCYRADENPTTPHDTSPAGSTVSAICEAENRGVDAAVLAAIEASPDRATELGKHTNNMPHHYVAAATESSPSRGHPSVTELASLLNLGEDSEDHFDAAHSSAVLAPYARLRARSK